MTKLAKEATVSDSTRQLFDNLGDRNRFFTKSELAERLRCSTKTVERAVKRGMPVVLVGADKRFDWDEVVCWLKQRTRSTWRRNGN